MNEFERQLCLSSCLVQLRPVYPLAFSAVSAGGSSSCCITRELHTGRLLGAVRSSLAQNRVPFVPVLRMTI